MTSYFYEVLLCLYTSILFFCMFPGKNGFSCIYIYVAMDHYYLHIKIKDDYENKEIALPL